MNSSKIEMRALSMELIYSDWKRRFDSVEDSDLRKILDGYLAKCYLHSCCELGQVLDVPGVGKGFLLGSALKSKRTRQGAVVFGCPDRLSALRGQSLCFPMLCWPLTRVLFLY